ncbi:MAG TPA: hypothetical protein VNE67_08970 [Acetobacteraceae bacterium]|nr:hypothetical protein [Acetobacteraceae bacterium]
MLSIDLDYSAATIAAAGSLSGAVGLGSKTLVGIAMPAAWTAAALTFQASADGGTTWLEVYSSSGTEVSLTAAAGQFIAIDPATWRGINDLKVRSGTAGVPVVQSGGAIVTLVTRSVL